MRAANAWPTLQPSEHQLASYGALELCTSQKADKPHTTSQSWLSPAFVLPPTRASVPELIWLDDTCSAQLS